MERLTDWDKGDAYYPKCSESPCDGMGCTDERCEFKYLKCRRLAEYEDTGLAPEEIAKIKEITETQAAKLLLYLIGERDDNGWIPVTDWMPKDGARVMATIVHHAWITDYRSTEILDADKTIHPKYTESCEVIYREGRWEFCDRECDYEKGYAYIEPDTDLSQPIDEVIAWRPMPEPYKPQTLANADNDTTQPGFIPGV